MVRGMEFQLTCYGRPRKFMVTSVEAEVPENDVVQQYELHALPSMLPSLAAKEAPAVPTRMASLSINSTHEKCMVYKVMPTTTFQLKVGCSAHTSFPCRPTF